jgi:hypothetical protein
MPWFRDKRQEEIEAEAAALAEDEAPPPPGTWLLMEGPLYADWYLRFRLEQEIARSRRYGSAFAILIAEPQLIAQERVSAEGTLAAADAAMKAARNTDLVGWMGDGNIMVIMPETDAASGRFAVNRLRDEMWLLSHGRGGHKWEITLIDDLERIEEIAGVAPDDQPTSGTKAEDKA